MAIELPTLRTPRLTLRPLRESDRAEYIRIHEISRAFHQPWSSSREQGKSLDEQFNSQLERTLAGNASGKDARFAAFLDEVRLVGHFHLNEIVRGAFQNAYAGWRVSVDVARKGYATEALKALLDFAFTPAPQGLGLHRTQANIIPHNLASRRLAEKVGFRMEGLAKAYLEIAGQWQDHAMYAKVAEEHRMTSVR